MGVGVEADDGEGYTGGGIVIGRGGPVHGDIKAGA